MGDLTPSQPIQNISEPDPKFYATPYFQNPSYPTSSTFPLYETRNKSINSRYKELNNNPLYESPLHGYNENEGIRRENIQRIGFMHLAADNSFYKNTENFSYQKPEFNTMSNSPTYAKSRSTNQLKYIPTQYRVSPYAFVEKPVRQTRNDLDYFLTNK